jgi:hypothetical protein
MMAFRTLRSKCALLVTVCLLVLAAAGNAAADTISVTWDPSGSTVGYKVHVGVQSGSYTQHFDAGASTVWAFTTATAGQRYCFAVSAYTLSSGVEGPNSGEVCGYSNAAPTLVNPGSRTSTVGQPTSLQLQGFDSQPITYSASGLPPGLSLMTSTGYISGTGTTAGTYSVTARASDGVLSTSQSFTWTMTTSTSTSTSTSTGDWSVCANEGGTCAFSGTQQVRYGANGLYAYRTLTGGTACTNAVFGDPAPGVVKQCHTSTSTSTSTGSWSVCANEGGTCAFSGTQQVRYGANGLYAYRTLTGGTACTNAVFGDPAPGLAKQCHTSTSTSTASWSVCANEGGTCAFTGTQQVRYGANGSYAYRTLTGGTACTNSVFGDPAPGITKQCAIGATSSTSSGGTTIDTTAPTVSISTPTTGSTYSTTQSTINLSGTAADNRGVVQVAWMNSAGGNGVASGTTSWAIANLPLQSGTNVVTVTALDAAGNAATSTLTVTRSTTSSTSSGATSGTVCATAPTVSICTPTTATSYSTTQSSITMTGTAPFGITRVVWENVANGARGVASGTTSWTIASVPLVSGSNLIEITAYDSAGNPSTDRLVVTR